MTDREHEVMRLFAEERMAPSDIDRMLVMNDGRAHDIIVDAWHRDKVKHGRGKGE